jgi:hypothetical protein
MATLIDSKMLSRAGRASSTNFRILQHKEKIAMGKTEKLIVKDWFPTVISMQKPSQHKKLLEILALAEIETQKLEENKTANVSIQSEAMKSDVSTSKTSSFVSQSRVQFYESIVRYS